MAYRKNLLLAIALLGIGAIVTTLALHNHIVKVRAARLDHAIPPAPYFPPGSIWTQDISHAPVDPQSDAIISWLADAGGWGHGNKMQVDLEHPGVAGRCRHSASSLSQRSRVLYCRFRHALDLIPLPPGGGVEGRARLSVRY